jgi:hypothetical protein
MNELKQTVIHHIEQAAQKAGVNFDADCRAELVECFDAAERRIARLERLNTELFALVRVDDPRR